MRIITWNVNYLNRTLDDLITYALSNKPDIVCLQEVPQRSLDRLEHLPGYAVYSAPDLHNTHKNKDTYICTLSRIPFIYNRTVQYFHKAEMSLLNRVLYRRIWHVHEGHNMVLTDVTYKGNVYCIVNMRLSCAVGSADRLMQFRHVLSHLTHNAIPIICGDMNVTDNLVFKYATGWIRGFKRHDYQLNERQEFEHLLDEHALKNIFSKCKTTTFYPFLVQLDHIITPKAMAVTRREISGDSYGSDHKMLLVDAEV